jgi:AraC family transcriptional regulator
VFFSAAALKDGAPGEVPAVAAKPAPATLAAMQRLRVACRAVDGAAAIEQGVFDLLDELLRHAAHLRRLEQRGPAVKASTRGRLLARVERARALIEDCIAERLTLDDLAKAAGLSRFHLLRAFKAFYGETPLAFAERRRMARAQEMLAAPAARIVDVAASLGYESQSAFARTFRAHVGLSPRVFRAR